MSKEQNKNYGKSIRTKLLNVARKENVFNQTILTRYFQERLLYRISQTHYRGNFYLKGDALMYAYEKFAARPTAFIRKITSTDILSFTEVIAFLQQRLLPFWENMKDE